MTNDAALTLANCLEAIERHELTLDQYLARHPDQHLMLTELVPLAQHLRAAPAVTPSLDFRADARRRLISQLSPRRSPRTGTLTRNWARVIPSAARNLWAGLTTQALHIEIPRRRPHSAALRGLTSAAPRNDTMRIGSLRLVRALAVLIILIVLGSSVIVASAQSLPNEALYPVKITFEQVRLALSPDQLTRGELSLNFADERLNEVQRLIDRGEGTEAAGALDAFAGQIQSAVEMVHSSPASAEREALLARLQTSIDRSDEMLANSEGQPANLGAAGDSTRACGLASRAAAVYAGSFTDFDANADTNSNSDINSQTRAANSCAAFDAYATAGRVTNAASYTGRTHYCTNCDRSLAHV